LKRNWNSYRILEIRVDLKPLKFQFKILNDNSSPNISKIPFISSNVLGVQYKYWYSSTIVLQGRGSCTVLYHGTLKNAHVRILYNRFRRRYWSCPVLQVLWSTAALTYTGVWSSTVCPTPVTSNNSFYTGVLEYGVLLNGFTMHIESKLLLSRWILILRKCRFVSCIRRIDFSQWASGGLWSRPTAPALYSSSWCESDDIVFFVSRFERAD
jgi:hypothetical protein